MRYASKPSGAGSQAEPLAIAGKCLGSRRRFLLTYAKCYNVTGGAFNLAAPLHEEAKSHRAKLSAIFSLRL